MSYKYPMTVKTTLMEELRRINREFLERKLLTYVPSKIDDSILPMKPPLKSKQQEVKDARERVERGKRDAALVSAVTKLRNQ
jgi:hypothetical protein